jgi:hypothetical protein
VFAGCAGPALALDLFTLWRQPMVPLELREGDRVDYKTVTMAGGKRSVDLVRVQCVGQIGPRDGRSWLVEMLPLEQTSAGLMPVAGEGLLIQLAAGFLRKEGELTDLVQRVVRWQDGSATELSAEEWREDPLVRSSLRSEFRPQRAEIEGTTTRVVGAHELLCQDFTLAATDTQRVRLPRGSLEQVSSREITASLNDQVPFLGLVFASERTQSESRLDPPSERFTVPPPVIQVETMELIAFGQDAQASLSPH